MSGAEIEDRDRDPRHSRSRPNVGVPSDPADLRARRWTAALGHEERFPPPRLNGRCRFDSGRLRDEVKQPSITLDVCVDIHQAVAIEESNMLALVDGRPARM